MLWTVRDGEDSSVLVLASCFSADIEKLKVSLSLPRRPVSVFTGRGDRPEVVWRDGRATLSLRMAKGDGEIIVFRYEEK